LNNQGTSHQRTKHEHKTCACWEQGFVNKAEDYPWSSIANCFHEEGLIEIELIEYTRHKSSTHKARTQDLRQLGQVLNQSLNRLKNNLKEEHKIRQKSEHI